MYSTFLLKYNVNGEHENLAYHKTMHEALLVYFHSCLVCNQDAAEKKSHQINRIYFSKYFIYMSKGSSRLRMLLNGSFNRWMRSGVH